MLNEGDAAPAFALRDDTEKTVQLKDFLGHPLVVYFFPRADTPG
jgi:thioredoxin-dependent peroxiredoxin